ncbi:MULTISPECIES: DUF805 domain-containing protein [unclassified Brevundimonas]|uniref:DUF805 domain-containing protein n=1 Tax=unclassified Brevundimonas TaxID=2622653 RepID=UPI003F8DE05F
MRGEILSYDDVSGTGLISGDDSIRYGFARAAIQAGGVIRSGARVDFVPEGVEATQIMVLASSPAAAFGQAAASSYVARDTGGGYDIKSAFFSFKGRMRRQHFWISWAILFGLGIVSSFIPKISFFLGLILLVGHLAVGFKRFHDMGKPGWLVVIPWALWYAALGLMVASFGLAVLFDPNAMQSMDPETLLATGGTSFALVFLSAIVSLGFWLWLGIGDSQRGDNQYGPNPKGE